MGNSNSNCATKVTPTPKRKASGSPLDEISLVPVKKEKNMKAPQLAKIQFDATEMEQSYSSLEKAEKGRVGGDRRQKWSDDELSILLVSIYRNLEGNAVVKFWPNDDYPRSPAVVKKKLAELRGELKLALGIERQPKKDAPNPEADGSNALILLSPLLISLDDGLAVFGYPQAHFGEVLAGALKDFSGARFRLTRLPFASEAGVTTGIPPLFVQYQFPPGYSYVRKYDRPETDVLPIKGFVLRVLLDEPVGDLDEIEMF